MKRTIKTFYTEVLKQAFNFSEKSPNFCQLRLLTGFNMTVNRLCEVLYWFSSCNIDVFSIQRNKISFETEADGPGQHEREEAWDWVGAQDFSTSYPTHLATNPRLFHPYNPWVSVMLAISLLQWYLKPAGWFSALQPYLIYLIAQQLLRLTV